MTWHAVTDDFPPLDGGIATWAERVAHELGTRGESVTVWTREREDLETGEPTPTRPFAVHGVGGRSFGRWGPIYTTWNAWNRVRAGDRLLATTWPMARFLHHRCRAVGARLHVVFHGSDVTRLRPAQVGSLRAVCARADHRWAVSRYLAETLRDRGCPAKVLPAPVDLPQVEPVVAPAPLRWVTVARATPLKGVDRVLRLLAGTEHSVLTVVGDGPELGAWRQLAQDLGVGERVTFTGRVCRDAVQSHLVSSQLAWLLPRTAADGSGAEGLGLTLLEAAALGLGTVGCDTGGVPEAVGPGLVLRDPDDVPRSLASLERWWDLDAGQRCQEWVQGHHGTHRLVDALQEAS